MCVFCAAVPATLAVGASANARLHRQEKQAQAQLEEPPKPAIQPKTATAVVVGGLLVCSVIYHSQFGS